MWVLVASALAVEPGRVEILVERVTEPMHWFAASAMDVEGIVCTIGVPVDGDGDPWVGCAFPGGRIEDPQVPRELGGAARRARKALRDAEPGASAIRVTWLATEQRVWLCDHVVLPNGLWSTGQAVYGVVAGQVRPAVGAHPSGGGESLLGCQGRPIASVEADRSLIFTASFEGDATARERLDGVVTTLARAIEALPPTPSAPTRRDTVPAGLLVVDGRPRPGGSEFWVHLPTDRLVGTRVSYTLHGPEGATDGGGALVGGFPDDWAALAGPVVPEGHTVVGRIEVFATDVPVGPEWTPETAGFERIHTAALLAPR